MSQMFLDKKLHVLNILETKKDQSEKNDVQPIAWFLHKMVLIKIAEIFKITPSSFHY